MFLCRICSFEASLDDAALRFPDGWCICLACYNRTVGMTLLMPKSLRREIIAVVDSAVL